MGHPCKHIFEARDPPRSTRSSLTSRTDGRAETYACMSCAAEATILRVGPLRRLGHVKHLFCRDCGAYLMHERIG